MKGKSIIVLAGAVLLASTQIASAHPGHGASGFAAGVAHPFSGIDHILAMFAVGLVATQIGKRAIWLLPLTFLLFMVGGGLLATSGTPMPMVEQGIAASVLLLGLMVIAGSRMAMPLALGLVGLFAMFHGYAHGIEMHSGLSPAAYGAGFVAATTALLFIGMLAGIAIKRTGMGRVAPFAGGAIALSGLLLLMM